jgi:urease accessory protein
LKPLASLRLALAICLTAVALSASPALAHAPIKGIGTFYNGVLHPVLVPAHLLLIAGLALHLGQNATRVSRYGWFAFVAAFWTGLAAGYLSGTAVPQAALLAFALVSGLLVALALPFGVTSVVILMSVAGVGIGLDSRPDPIQHREIGLALVGTAIGGMLLLSYIAGVAASLLRPWQRIAVRVAGSWTAASASIVLALTLAGQKATG